MARSWRDVRAEAVASGRVDPARADAARRRMKVMEHAHTLAEVRKTLGMLRQEDIAQRMGVSQARVSKLERGDLAHTELGTLLSYIQAMGGELKIEARIGDNSIDLIPT